jgi:hypothetical protein
MPNHGTRRESHALTCRHEPWHPQKGGGVSGRKSSSELVPRPFEPPNSRGIEVLPKPLFVDFLNTAETHTRALPAAASGTQNHPAR